VWSRDTEVGRGQEIAASEVRNRDREANMCVQGAEGAGVCLQVVGQPEALGTKEPVITGAPVVDWGQRRQSGRRRRGIMKGQGGNHPSYMATVNCGDDDVWSKRVRPLLRFPRT
jgi:hypothetical protein